MVADLARDHIINEEIEKHPTNVPQRYTLTVFHAYLPSETEREYLET